MAKLLQELVLRFSTVKDQSVNSQIREMKSEINSLSGELGSLTRNGGIALMGLSAALGFMVKGWLDASGAMALYRAKLETVLKSAEEAQDSMNRAIELAPKAPFDVEGIVNANTQLTVYGQNAEKWLPLVGDLAAGMGQDIKYSSLVMGKALSGSRMGLRSLANEFGITTATLERYGMKANGMGGIILETTEDHERLHKALEAIIKTNFAGAMEKQANTLKGAFSNFYDALKVGAASLGSVLAPAIVFLVRRMTDLINVFAKAPAIIKAPVAGLGILAVALTGVSGAGLILLSQLPMLKIGWMIVTNEIKKYSLATIAASAESIILSGALKATGLSMTAFGKATSFTIVKLLLLKGLSVVAGAIKSIGVAIGWVANSVLAMNPVFLGIAAIGIAVGGALAYLTSKYEKQSEALRNEIKKDEEALRSFRDMTRKYSQATADDLYRAGVSYERLSNDIANAEKMAKKVFLEAQEAIKKGDTERADMLMRFGKKIMENVRHTRELSKAVKEQELAFRGLNSAMTNVVTQYSLMKKMKLFGDTGNELTYVSRRLSEIREKMKGAFNFSLKGTDKDFQILSDRLIEINQKLEKAGEDGDNNQKQRLKSEKELIEQYVELYSTQMDLRKKEMDEMVKDSDDRQKTHKEDQKKELDLIREKMQIKKNLGELDLQGELRWLEVLKGRFKNNESIKRELEVETSKIKKEIREKTEKEAQETAKRTARVRVEAERDAAQKVQDILSSNRDSITSIGDLESSAWDRSLDELKKRLEEGEDVVGKVVEKLRQKAEIEETQIEKTEESLRRKGVTEELILDQVSRMEEEAHEKQKARIEEIIGLIRKKKEEEKSDERRPGRHLTFDQMLQEQKDMFSGKKDDPKEISTSLLDMMLGRTKKEIEILQKDGKRLSFDERKARELSLERAAVNIGNIIINMDGKKGTSAKVSASFDDKGRLIFEGLPVSLKGEVAPTGR